MGFATWPRFGRWVFLKPASKDRHNNSRWECRCDCGAVRIVLRNNLVTGRSTQCEDCSNRERREARALRPKKVKVKVLRPPREIPGLRLTYDGRTLLLSQWKTETGLPTECIRNRLKRKWTVGQALGFEERIQRST